MTGPEQPQTGDHPDSRLARMWRVAVAGASQPDNCTLRQLGCQDAAAVAALAHQAFLGGPDEASQDVLCRKVSAILAGSYGRFIAAASFVHACAQGAIDAAILVTDYAPYGAPVVALVVVGKPVQQQGIGTALMGRSLAALQLLGHTACCARITAGNLASERLFQGRGFVPASC